MANRCSEPGCDRPIHARGLCNTHYDRLRRGSDPDMPKARGGRRSDPNRPKRQLSENSLRNLKPMKPGETRNPYGVSRTVLDNMRLARDLTPGVIEELNRIVHDPDASNRDKVMAGVAIMDRGGKPPVGIFHGTGPGMPPGHVEGGTEDGTSSLLLRSAATNADAKMLSELKEAQRRIEAKLAQEEQAHEAHLADAAAAMARGEEVPGLTRLLLNAKAASAANAERRAAAAPPPRQPRLESKPDVFIADLSGNIAAPATVESAPLESEPSSKSEPPAPPKPPPFRSSSRTRRRRPRRREAPRRSPRILVVTFLASANF